MKNKNKYTWLMVSSFLWVLSLQAQDGSKGTSVRSQSTTLKTVFSIFGGRAIPTGDFSDPNIGAANAGFTLGVQFVIGDNTGFLLNASYTSNPTNLGETIQSEGGIGSSGNWNSFLYLAGLKFGTSKEIGPNFFFAPVVGVMSITRPDLDYSITETYPGLVITQNYSTPSASSHAFAYGAMIELDIKSVTLGARYLESNPTFDYSTRYSESTGVETIRQGSAQQSISFLQILLGIAF